MSFFDLLFSPKGTIKPQPFAIVALAVYVINIAAGSILDGGFLKRAGVAPYLALQVMLTWIWFAVHAKRLRDAGRGYAVAATLAFLYIAGVLLLMGMFATTSAPVADQQSPDQSNVSLIGVLFAVLFINTLFTGDAFLITTLLFVFIAGPLLFALGVVIYSIVTGTRKSLTPALQQAQLPAA